MDWCKISVYCLGMSRGSDIPSYNGLHAIRIWTLTSYLKLTLQWSSHACIYTRWTDSLEPTMAKILHRCTFNRSNHVSVEYDSANKVLLVAHNHQGGHECYVASITFNVKQKCHDGEDMYFPWLVSHVPLGTTRRLRLAPCGLSDDTVVRKWEPSSARNEDSCVVRVQFSKSSGISTFSHIGLPSQCDMIELTGLGTRMIAVQLYHRAVQYFTSRNGRQRKMNRATFLYRDKSKDYFDDVFLRHCGIMNPYLKYYAVDSKCPISGQLKGLFFSSNVDNNTQEPVKPSVFGRCRFQVPLAALLRNLRRWRIYFANFYCRDKAKSSHRITLVLCKEGSESDDICKKYLLAMPPETPFFRVMESGFLVSSLIWVEVLYTEPINVHQMCQNDGGIMETVESNTRSVKAGIHTNSRCLICNTAMYQSWEALSDSFWFCGQTAWTMHCQELRFRMSFILTFGITQKE